ncbi:hypothetical protein ACW9IK_32810, partial [Pseudomonas gingeri]
IAGCVHNTDIVGAGKPAPPDSVSIAGCVHNADYCGSRLAGDGVRTGERKAQWTSATLIAGASAITEQILL